MEEIRARAQVLRRTLRTLVDRDAEVYRAFLARPGPDTTRDAILVPLEIAECAGEVRSLGEEAARAAFPALAPDCRGALRFADAACEQAAETVQVNLEQVKDEDFAAGIRDRLGRIPRTLRGETDYLE